jgi:hypothetical protein
MLSERQQDGHLIFYPAAAPVGRLKRLLHINGMQSPYANQLRDLEALVWLTVDQPFDVIGIHNSTEGFQADIVESFLGKAELYRFWPEHQTRESQARLQGYAGLLQTLSTQELPPEGDILQILQDLQGVQRPPGTPLGGQMMFDLDLLRRLPFIQKMTWSEFEAYFYGSYPPGAPRATLRLAYEMIKGVQAGCEVFLVAHSQGMIIAAIALHIVQQFFGDYQKWFEQIRLIGYGPAILFEDLPVHFRSQTIMIQHRQDLVAESLSNIRNVNAWSNLQTHLRKVLEQAEGLFQLANRDSHHSATLYLGLQEIESSQRSARLLALLLGEDWPTSPVIQSLRGSRIILEESPAGALSQPGIT